ncbi:hypothetical protein Tco_0467787 [Tanacetum coccineum]
MRADHGDRRKLVLYAPIVTKTVDGKETVIPPTSVFEEKATKEGQRLKAKKKALWLLEQIWDVICYKENSEQRKSSKKRDGFEVEHCYADYEGKKIPKEYWKEAGHGQQNKLIGDQAEEGPTNFALMAYSSTSLTSSTKFEVSNDLNCCSSCLECVKDLKEQNEQLVKDLRTARISVVSYKTGLHFDDKLQFVEEPIEITDREVKRLKRSRIPLVKVRWNSKRGPEFTWEREDQFRKKYPHLFSKTGPSSSAAS